MPPPRSAGTCVQCRTRKVRCSGGAPCCANCERLEYPCSFAVSRRGERAGDGDGGASTCTPLEKRRRPLACAACRSSKSKCTGERPACEPCRTRSKACVYPDSKRRRSHAGSEPTTSSGARLMSASHHGLGQSPRASLREPGYSDGNETPSSMVSPLSQVAGGIAASEYSESYSGEGLSPSAGSHLGGYDATVAPTREARTESWRSSASNVSVDSPDPTSSALPKLHEQLQVINDYFRHIHAHPGSAFLSEVSVTKRCLDGTIDAALLLAICAFTASVLRYPRYYPAQSATWVQKAEDLLWRTMERPTVFRTQALLLAVLCRVETGHFKRGYMLLSMASRSASALRLQYERLDLDHHSQEVRRRLTWSIMLVDNYFSVGLPESGTCPPDFIYLRMPCPEEDFHGDGQTGPGPASLDGVSEGGLLQLYIRLSIIRRDILRLTRNLSLQVNVTTQITGLVDGMLNSLKLAEPRPYSTDELKRYANSRWLVRYIAVQIGWRQSHCDIYRIFLSGYREAAPDDVIRVCTPDYVAQAATACLLHARALIDIIHAVDRLRPLFGSSAMLGKTVQELDRIITAHVSGTPVYPGGAEDSNSGRPRYAMTIQKHTSLGVHSAFRQAQFHEDDEDSRGIGTGYNTRDTNSNRSATTTSTAYPDVLSAPANPQAVMFSERDQENADHRVVRSQSVLAAADRSGDLVLLGNATESMDLSALNLNIWSARGWQHDFSPGSAHDCM
ncbi:hypothetical protein PG993_008563 [Apiospora rasikravindrae]|uniref:Zn(2)-C6 fungal-type domain-containing protein n=1 Tax=Apiospora rasikravindrae TaxID=990691 RepID=A0ABR1T0P8_9PEZI